MNAMEVLIAMSLPGVNTLGEAVVMVQAAHAAADAAKAADAAVVDPSNAAQLDIEDAEWLAVETDPAVSESRKAQATKARAAIAKQKAG